MVSVASSAGLLHEQPVTGIKTDAHTSRHKIKYLKFFFIKFSNLYKRPKFKLFKILNTGFEDLKILLTIDVNCNTIVTTLCMSHLTKYTAVG